MPPPPQCHRLIVTGGRLNVGSVDLRVGGSDSAYSELLDRLARRLAMKPRIGSKFVCGMLIATAFTALALVIDATVVTCPTGAGCQDETAPQPKQNKKAVQNSCDGYPRGDNNEPRI